MANKILPTYRSSKAQGCDRKKPYTKRVALQMISECGKHGDTVKAYKCPHCRKYHLTSKF